MIAVISDQSFLTYLNMEWPEKEELMFSLIREKKIRVAVKKDLNGEQRRNGPMTAIRSFHRCISQLIRQASSARFLMHERMSSSSAATTAPPPQQYSTSTTDVGRDMSADRPPVCQTSDGSDGVCSGSGGMPPSKVPHPPPRRGNFFTALARVHVNTNNGK